MKIVVFDLDETLGYFVEFGIFWDCLNRYYSSSTQYSTQEEALTQEDFNGILDLYPEFLRPNIINILTYLKKKKQLKCCNKIMIYTNNQGPKIWANHLISYFESKLNNFKLFDQIICAFKVNGKRVELCRSSHDKSYNDLIKCTKLPLNAEICFLDDNYFPGMSNKSVYYINIKPYLHDLKFEEVLRRFMDSEIGEKIIKDEDNLNSFEKHMMSEFKAYNFKCIEKHEEEYEIDKILGKQIMTHLQTFFNTSFITGNIRTKKNNRFYRNNKTRRQK
jgi:hypothetical protein